MKKKIIKAQKHKSFHILCVSSDGSSMLAICLQNLFSRNSNVLTSFCMQLRKLVIGSLWEADLGEGGCPVGWKGGNSILTVLRC